MPRQGLNQGSVVNAAQRLVDEVGYDNLTLRAVADDLGVRQPSLYKHIDSLADLQHHLSVVAKEELARVLSDAAVARSGEDALRSLADAYRAWAKMRPGSYAATVRAGEPEDEANIAAGAKVVAVVTKVLASLEIYGEEAIHATRALRACLHGFSSLEADHGFGLREDVDASFRYMVDVLVAGLTATADGRP